MKTKNNFNIQVCLILFLMIATISLSFLAENTYSRYVSNTNAESTVSVASFFIGGEVNIDITDMSPGDTRETYFTVTNYNNNQISEVNQTYNITIVTTGNLPLVFNLQCTQSDGGGSVIAEHSPQTLISGIPVNGGFLPIYTNETQTIHTYTLTVLWPQNVNNIEYSHEVDYIVLSVDSQQVD